LRDCEFRNLGIGGLSDMSFLDRIREKARNKIIYTEHALDEMIAEEEMISKDEVRHVIFKEK